MEELSVKPTVVIIMVVILGCAVITSIIIKWKQKQMQDEMATLVEKLDNALNGEVQETFYDESMDSNLTERLNKFVEAFDIQNSRDKKEKDAMRVLISDLSHQIRTPLTNIMLYTGLLQERMLGHDEKALADKIQKQVEKLDFFMKELVRTSYTETEMITLLPQKNSVEELINSSCQVEEMFALKKGILIEHERTELQAIFDMKWTIEGISNIIDNAIKYSVDNSKIFIKIIEYESFVCIKIKDEGSGIKEEEQGLIFQRFYRASNAKEKSGFGIGLYLSREIFARERAYVKVQSKVGVGSTFNVFLPKY